MVARQASDACVNPTAWTTVATCVWRYVLVRPRVLLARGGSAGSFLTNEAEVLMALERGGMQAIGVSLHANLTHAERLTLPERFRPRIHW